MKKLLLLSLILVASFTLTAQDVLSTGDDYVAFWNDYPMDTAMIFGRFQPEITEIMDVEGYTDSFILTSFNDEGYSDEQLMTVLLSMEPRIDYMGTWWSQDGITICYNDRFYESDHMYRRYNRHHPYWQRGHRPPYGGLIFFFKTN